MHTHVHRHTGTIYLQLTYCKLLKSCLLLFVTEVKQLFVVLEVLDVFFVCVFFLHKLNNLGNCFEFPKSIKTACPHTSICYGLFEAASMSKGRQCGINLTHKHLLHRSSNKETMVEIRTSHLSI